MTSFADHYTLAHFQALQEHAGRCPKDMDAMGAWCEAGRPHDEVLDRAVGSFLEALRAARELRPVLAMYKRTHRLAHAWNAYVAGNVTVGEMDYLRYKIGNALASVHRVRKAEDVESLYWSIVEQSDRGDLAWYCTDSGEVCQTTGERLHMEWLGWVPCLGTRQDPSVFAYKSPLVAASVIPPAPVVQHEINAPTGELLIADWFRIEGFTTAVKDPAAGGEYSSCSSAGCQRQAAWYAKQFGFASIFVGDCGPNILVRKGSDADRSGHIVLAQIEESYRAATDPAGGTLAGSVCTDLWWTTIIDRQVLTSIVARSMSQAEAERAVQGLVDEGNMTRVQVRPGKLFVYHTADFPEMNAFECAQAPTAGVELLYGVISERELTFTRKINATA